MPTVLITNANFGQGLALAKIYAASGWEVIAVNARPFAPRDYAELGYDIRELRYDLSMDGAIADFKTRLGGHPLDLVVLTPALPLSGPDAEALSAEVFEAVMVQNTLTPALLMPVLAENLQKGTGKTLVLISSAEVAFARPATTDALAEKASIAALHQILRSLAVEWKPLGLCVAVIAAEGAKAAACIDALSMDQSGSFRGKASEQLAW